MEQIAQLQKPVTPAEVVPSRDAPIGTKETPAHDDHPYDREAYERRHALECKKKIKEMHQQCFTAQPLTPSPDEKLLLAEREVATLRLIIEPKADQCQVEVKVGDERPLEDDEVRETPGTEPQPEPSDLFSLLNMSQQNLNTHFPSSTLPDPRATAGSALSRRPLPEQAA